MNQKMEEILRAAMRQASNNAFDAAIELCELIAADGHEAMCCVEALKKLRADVQNVYETLPLDVGGMTCQ